MPAHSSKTSEGHLQVDDLVVRARDGSLEAFEGLYQTHQAGIYAFIRAQVRDPELAADLTQQTFVRAWESLPRLRDTGAFRGWLHRIAMNLIRDDAKSGRSRLEVVASSLEEYDLSEVASTAEPPAEALLGSELNRQVRRALHALPVEQRQAVVMHHLEGLGVAEIARVQGVRPGTVMSRLARAREALRGRLARYVEGTDGDV
jgi:RNA polymerase sigma-70 factor (ECF subfamily)